MSRAWGSVLMARAVCLIIALTIYGAGGGVLAIPVAFAPFVLHPLMRDCTCEGPEAA